MTPLRILTLALGVIPPTNQVLFVFRSFSRSQLQTQVKNFASYIRVTAWNFGFCYDNIVIMVSKEDRKVCDAAFIRSFIQHSIFLGLCNKYPKIVIDLSFAIYISIAPFKCYGGDRIARWSNGYECIFQVPHQIYSTDQSSAGHRRSCP